MRVAVVSAEQRPLRAGGREWATGSAAHLTELSIALARLGHDVRIFTRQSSASQPAKATDAHGVTVVNVPPGASFGRWLDESWRDGWAPDVVHAHAWPDAVAALAARRLTRRPTVVTFSGPPADLPSHDEVDGIVTLSRSDADLLARLGVPPAKVSVIPSGVDIDRFRPDGRAWGRRRTHRILAAGQLVDANGFADAVAALPDLPDTELVIVGRPPPPSHGLGPYAAELRASAVNGGSHDRLRLTGASPYADMPGWYRSADLLICTPQHACLNRAALEAMACGIPVVATATGGLAETVTDGITGRLIRTRTPLDLAAAIRALLTDSTLRRRFGAAATERIRRHHSWRDAAKRTIDAYDRAREQCRMLNAASYASA
jgi:D-inositol-3-phosphate glycosyltransferase